MSTWLARFWGNRKTLIRDQNPDNRAKLEIYRKTKMIVVDETGHTLIERRPIYSPDGESR